MEVLIPEQGPFVEQYFEGDRFVGERAVFCYTTDWSSRTYSCYYPHTAFCCPTCGKIWGRKVNQHHAGYRPIPKDQWVYLTRPCPKHGNGLFLELILNEHLLTCSQSLLKREAELLLCHERNR